MPADLLRVYDHVHGSMPSLSFMFISSFIVVAIFVCIASTYIMFTKPDASYDRYVRMGEDPNSIRMGGVVLGVFGIMFISFIAFTFYDSTVPTTLYPKADTQIKPKLRPAFEQIYEQRFINQQWRYNAEVVYSHKLATENPAKLVKLRNAIAHRDKLIKTNQADLRKLKWLKSQFQYKVKIGDLKKVYPNIHDHKIKLEVNTVNSPKIQKQIEKQFLNDK